MPQGASLNSPVRERGHAGYVRTETTGGRAQAAVVLTCRAALDLGTREHERFIEAVRRRDPEAATKIMREHLERTARRVGH